MVVKVEIKNSDKHFEFLQPILTYTNEKNIKVRKELYKNKPSTNDYLRKQNAYDIAALHFDFAANYFVTEIPIQELKNSIIHLEDENGKIVGEKYVVKQEHNITIKSYQYYGRCRARGKKEFLSILDKPEKGSKLLFKNLYYEDFEYNKF